MRGRPRKPTMLKVLDGSFRADRANLMEPILPPAPIVPAPARLSRFAKKIWKEWSERLTRTRVLTENDWAALALACDTQDVFEMAQAVIRKEGITVLEPVYAKGVHVGDVVRERPEVSIASDASRRLITLYDRLGMTPSGRSQVIKTEQPQSGLLSGARKRG